MSIFKQEPVLVLGVVQAVLALVVSFGLNLTGDQIGAILAVSAAILSVVARTQVLPTSKVSIGPVDPDPPIPHGA